MQSRFSETLAEAAERPAFRGLLRARKSESGKETPLRRDFPSRSAMPIFLFPRMRFRRRQRPVRECLRPVRQTAGALGPPESKRGPVTPRSPQTLLGHRDMPMPLAPRCSREGAFSSRRGRNEIAVSRLAQNRERVDHAGA